MDLRLSWINTKNIPLIKRDNIANNNMMINNANNNIHIHIKKQ